MAYCATIKAECDESLWQDLGADTEVQVNGARCEAGIKADVDPMVSIMAGWCGNLISDHLEVKGEENA